MIVRPLASFFTVVRFSNEATSCPCASAQSTKHTTIVCIEVMRNFILPPQRNARAFLISGSGKWFRVGHGFSRAAQRHCRCGLEPLRAGDHARESFTRPVPRIRSYVEAG